MPSDQDVLRIAKRHIAARRVKTAGEVRFIKDRGGDERQWGWGSPGPTNREITPDYQFNPVNLKPLAQTLRATLMSMGHSLSAYNTFTKIKSARVSPDGALGGRGYIQKIADMRRAYMNIVEALSALSDTLYDEINAPHWNPAIEEQDPRERQEVRQIMDGVETIRNDPEEWAEGEEEGGEEVVPSNVTRAKNASDLQAQLIKRVAARHLGKG
jgi:hypothetical protein